MKFLKLIPFFATIIVAAVIIAEGLVYFHVNPLQSLAQTRESGNHDSKDKLTFTFKDNPQCVTGQWNNTNSYSYEVDITSNNGQPHTIIYNKYNFFCTDGHSTQNCTQNPLYPEYRYTATVPGNGYLPITWQRSPTDSNNNSLGSYCGRYQMDFEITAVDGDYSDTFLPIDSNGKPHPGSSGDCQTGVVCGQPQTHLACQSNACVSVAGPGSDQCQGNQDCQPQTHFECQNFACVQVSGAGTNQCSTAENNSPECSHLTCVSNACTRVVGGGEDTCTTNPDSCVPPQTHLTVVKVVNNNHGGTKQPGDFTLRVNGTQVTTGVPNLEQPGDYTVSEDSMNGYHQVSITGDCDSAGHVHLSSGDNKKCIIENEDNGTTPCQMPACNTTIAGCSYPYPDTTTCSCGPLVCITQTPSQNITVNVNQQQQQQQEVLAATVAPAISTTQLPSTGAGAEVLLSLAGLLPLGWKLRKFV